MNKLMIIILLVSCNTVFAEPLTVLCRAYEDNKTPGNYGSFQRTFSLDDASKSIFTFPGGKPYLTITWNEKEIIAEENNNERYDTTPAISKYSRYIFNRLTGAFTLVSFWRTDDGTVKSGDRLAAIASAHPLWQVWPFGIWEGRSIYGDCAVAKQHF